MFQSICDDNENLIDSPAQLKTSVKDVKSDRKMSPKTKMFGRTYNEFENVVDIPAKTENDEKKSNFNETKMMANTHNEYENRFNASSAKLQNVEITKTKPFQTQNNESDVLIEPSSKYSNLDKKKHSIKTLLGWPRKNKYEKYV